MNDWRSRTRNRLRLGAVPPRPDRPPRPAAPGRARPGDGRLLPRLRLWDRARKLAPRRHPGRRRADLALPGSHPPDPRHRAAAALGPAHVTDAVRPRARAVRPAGHRDTDGAGVASPCIPATGGQGQCHGARRHGSDHFAHFSSPFHVRTRALPCPSRWFG